MPIKATIERFKHRAASNTISKKTKKTLMIVFLLLILAVLAYFGYKWYAHSQPASAVYYF